MTRMLQIIKKAALEAVAASKPVGVYYGTVTGVNPLRIRTEQRLALGPAQLVQTDRVAGNLAAGDRVLLLREQGGQRYAVMAKVVST